MKAHRRAALWLRVSTDKQSHEAQRPEVEALARGRGFDVVAVYEEIASGAKQDRAKLAGMLDAAHRGAFDVLVVWRLDRLGRSMADIIATVTQLDRAGVQVVSVRESWLDMASPARALLLAVFAWVADVELQAGRERTCAGLAAARRRGVRLGRPERAIPLAAARALLADGLSRRAVARRLQVPWSTFREAMRREAA